MKLYILLFPGVVFPPATDDGCFVCECNVSHYVLQIVDLKFKQEPIFSLQTYNFSKDIHLFIIKYFIE